MRLETRQFNDHIWYIDNGLLDAAGVGTTYVVRGDEIAIVETGTSRCASNVLDGLQRLQIDPSNVRHIVLTHIHMDHAGGAGTLLKAMPEAQVYIHSRTAEFLTDPSRLVASAERALGDLFTLHGTVEMVDQERVVHADDLRLDLAWVSVHQDIQRNVSRDHSIADRFDASGAQAVRFAGKAERRSRTLVGFKQWLGGPRRLDRLALGQNRIYGLESFPAQIGHLRNGFRPGLAVAFTLASSEVIAKHNYLSVKYTYTA